MGASVAGVIAAPSAIRSAAPGRTTLALVLMSAGAALAPSLRPERVAMEAVAFGLVWVGSLVLLAAHHPSRYLSPAGIYLILFGLFHGGLLFSAGLRGDGGLVIPAAAGWLASASTPQAVRLCMLGCVAFTGAVLLARFRATPIRHDAARQARPAERTSFRVGVVGIGVLGFGLLATSAAIIGGGLAGGYGGFAASAAGSGLIAYGMLCIGLGAVFSMVGSPAQRKLGLVAYVSFAAIAIPVGLRGPVLFVAACLLAIEVRRGFRLRPILAILGTLVLLMLIGVVRDTRADGPTALLHGDWFASPLDAVGEMGFSLRPTVVVMGWHANGEPHRHGVTFVAVPLRVVEGLAGNPPSPNDDRLFNVEILARAGPIGGSPVAEGFHNFGVAGVAGTMAVIGALIGLLDRRRVSAANDAVLGIVLLPLVMSVRNVLGAVPAQVFVGLTLLGIALLIPRQTRTWLAMTAALRARSGSQATT